jgi:hypothetical protein
MISFSRKSLEHLLTHLLPVPGSCSAVGCSSCCSAAGCSSCCSAVGCSSCCSAVGCSSCCPAVGCSGCCSPVGCSSCCSAAGCSSCCSVNSSPCGSLRMVRTRIPSAERSADTSPTWIPSVRQYLHRQQFMSNTTAYYHSSHTDKKEKKISSYTRKFR